MSIKKLNDFCLENKKAIIYDRNKVVKGFVPASFFLYYYDPAVGVLARREI